MSHTLVVVAVSLLALASTPALAVASSSTPGASDDVSIAAPFQLNLARKFSSTVEQLERRGGGGSLKVSRRTKERSLSDELISLLKLAGAGQAYEPASPSQHTAAAVKPSAVWDPSAGDHTHAAAKPTGSRKPSHALAGKGGGPSAAYNSHLAAPTAGGGGGGSKPVKPKPSAAYHHQAHTAAAAPAATDDGAHPAPPPSKPTGAAKPSKSVAYSSASQSDATLAAAAPGASALVATTEHIAKRGVSLLEQVQKRIQEEPWENLDSQLLCPAGETACPIFPRMGTYECVDTASELENCGGCASRSLGEDCTQIKGALGLACQSGRCNVFTCQPGYEFEQLGRDGHGACVSSGSATSRGFFGARFAKKE
ncbi:hypothetical protein JCM3766R1_001553 [Sporobolomyces carnicolor]